MRNPATPRPRSPRARTALLVAFALLLSAAEGIAADIRIMFLPPPMEGTISLGIYNAEGRLVRVLHREAEVSAFTAELNGLVTYWDGADDRGVACPTGKYHAHGFMVGELEIEGVDFIGNDWVNEEEDTLRISRITNLEMSPSGNLVLKAMVPGQAQAEVFEVLFKGPNAEGETEPWLIRNPSLEFPRPSPAGWWGFVEGPFTPRAHRSVDTAPGTNGTVWVIEENTIKQYSAKGETLRTIATKPEDPSPIKLTASPTEEKVFVLEQNSKQQRLCCLDFTGVAPKEEPKVVFEQSIRFSDRFEQIAGELTFPDEKPFTPSPTLKLTLVPNPLLQDKPGSVEVAVKTDKTGSFFAAVDGLPLDHISETPNLRWAMMGREPDSNTATVFQSDGAVVEQFTASRLANMMAFDTGDFEWSPDAATPTVPPLPSPAPTGTPLANQTAR